MILPRQHQSDYSLAAHLLLEVPELRITLISIDAIHQVTDPRVRPKFGPGCVPTVVLPLCARCQKS